VIHTGVEFTPGGADGGLFFRKIAALDAFCRESPVVEYAPGLPPAPGELVVTKQYASAFFGTSLSSTLVALGIRALPLAGVSTSGCVRATAVDAIQHGFVPVVLRDAVGDRHPEIQQADLLDLQAKYPEVMDAAQALAQVVADTSGPRR
jgi:maleamate amidohydrolase